MSNKVHNGKSYTEIAALPAIEQLKLQGEGIDRGKIVSLYQCCYQFALYIETQYLNSLRILWKTPTPTSLAQT